MLTLLRYFTVVFFSVAVPEWLITVLKLGETPSPLLLKISMAIAFLFASASFISVRLVSRFPGDRSLVSIAPIVVAWYSLSLIFVFFTSLPYSVVYLGLSFLLCMLLVYLDYQYFEKNKPLNLAYYPIGRADIVESIPGANWIRMDTPALPAQRIDGVVTDLHAPALTDEWQKFLAQCTLKHVPVYNIRQIQESLTGRVKIRHMYENDLGSLLPSETYSVLKRIWETALVLLSMPVVLPIMIVTGIAIKLESEGPMLFLQKRVGQFGKEFTIYKFRSMCRDSEKDGAQFAQAGDMRVTRIGKFIRKTRIDELPQFFNIIRGEMALIGPRPEQKVFVDQFEEQIPFYNYRHIVKPGISGWAQTVHGYAADADETQVKIEHDFYYIKYFSFWLDVIIVFKTIRTMLTGFGAR